MKGKQEKHMGQEPNSFSCSTIMLFVASSFSCFLDPITCSASVPALSCRGIDHLALFQFRQSFTISKRASSAPDSYPWTNLWNMSEFADCCSWDGVECDPRTGHVTGLDLASSRLYGSIGSNSSLFNLVHLRSLDLSDNNFSFSSIPSQFGRLTQLTRLDLSSSWFSGIIPSEISKLSQMSTLDLSNNHDGLTGTGLLELGESDFRVLVQNLTSLKHLHLSYVNMESAVPEGLANLSALVSLRLSSCGLLGGFPAAVFQLPNLQVLDIENNGRVNGRLPEFHSHSEIKILNIERTDFSGQVPASIGNLNSLEQLIAEKCNLYGPLPTSLANLTKLSDLEIGYNRLNGSFPSSIWSNLTGLTKLSLRTNDFDPGHVIPSSLGELTNLQLLNLEDLGLTGGFPLWLTNLTRLQAIGLGNNSLQGPIPSSISRLNDLVSFHINRNSFSSVLDLALFLELSNLKYLYLGSNRWSSLLGRNRSNWVASARLLVLELSGSILDEFPEYLLKGQHQLTALDLSHNNIHGEIPDWLWENHFAILDLSYNSLTTSDQQTRPSFLLSQPDLIFLDLRSNMLQGSLPVPPSSVVHYSLSGNSFTGPIPQQFCQMSSIQHLDVSNNNLSGPVLDCLANSSDHLEVFDLYGNNFHGSVPSAWQSGSIVKSIRLGQNSLQGKIPRSLCDCKMLEFLDLGNNQMSDIFPSCLGNLPELKILILKSNKFYGPIATWSTSSGEATLFPKLRIIDLSNNRFYGALSTMPFEEFSAMKGEDVERLSYMLTQDKWSGKTIKYSGVEYVYSITINNKGIEMSYTKVIEVFVAIDLSRNKFEGKIPDSLQQLKGLRLLNLSSNILTGQIPSFIGGLTKLEALDLSQNKLVGRIPLQLTQLNFLEVFNVSSNNLIGPILRGKQFDTFPENSFDKNRGLCGVPLTILCEDSKPDHTALEQHGHDDLGLLDEGFDWKAVAIGFGGGLPIGLGFGYYEMFKRKRPWLLKFFGLRQ